MKFGKKFLEKKQMKKKRDPRSGLPYFLRYTCTNCKRQATWREKGTWEYGPYCAHCQTGGYAVRGYYVVLQKSWTAKIRDFFEEINPKNIIQSLRHLDDLEEDLFLGEEYDLM